MGICLERDDENGQMPHIRILNYNTPPNDTVNVVPIEIGSPETLTPWGDSARTPCPWVAWFAARGAWRTRVPYLSLEHRLQPANYGTQAS